MMGQMQVHGACSNAGGADARCRCMQEQEQVHAGDAGAYRYMQEPGMVHGAWCMVHEIITEIYSTSYGPLRATNLLFY